MPFTRDWWEHSAQNRGAVQVGSVRRELLEAVDAVAVADVADGASLPGKAKWSTSVSTDACADLARLDWEEEEEEAELPPSSLFRGAIRRKQVRGRAKEASG